MSISYEEALSTLQAMFGAPWTEESLDAVLRHYQGHMENTVEALLAHGDKDPLDLINKLQSGAGDNTNNTSLDEELARQLSSQAEPPRNNIRNSSSSSGTPAPSQQPHIPSLPDYKCRGTPTTLPDEFLRVKNQMASDEALARMLQDELFSEELRRNPDFAHLAGRPRQQQQHRGALMGRGSHAVQGPQVDIMEKISEMGNSAKFKLSQMAQKFKENTSRLGAAVGGAAAGHHNNNAAPQDSERHEMRGLLDRDNDAYELASRKDL